MKRDFSKSELFATGNSNWDYYLDFPWTDHPEKAAIWYVPKPDAVGCLYGYYGDITHVKKMRRLGYFNAELTELGKMYIG